MKRISSAVCAAALAAVVLLVTAASADDQATFSGTCHITGISKFTPNLTGQTNRVKYDFHSGSPDGGTTADATTCSGTLNGQSISNKEAVATVAGYGQLSCSQGASDGPGQGTLVIAGNTFPFAFTFSALLTEVDYTADNSGSGGGKAKGHASFLKYAPPDTAVKCAGDGIGQLGFEADDQMSDSPFKGTQAGSGGGGGGATGGGGTRTNPSSSTGSKRAQCLKKAKKIHNKRKRQAAMKKCKKRYKH